MRPKSDRCKWSFLGHSGDESAPAEPFGWGWRLLVLALVPGLTAAAQGQTTNPAIASFGGNGRLICTNLSPGLPASVEWAPSVVGP